MKRLFYFLTLLSILSINAGFTAQAQTRGNITGQIVDNNKKIVEFASIMLLKAKDSTLAKGALTDVNGQFEIESVADGNYLLSVSQVGYKKYFTPAFTIGEGNRVIKFPNIVLNEDAKQLGEVQVVAKKPFIEQQIDRTVVNVENSIVSAGSSAIEVLEKAPGVTVDKDGNISLKGKQSVMVMLDGKPTYMSASDLANMLRNMQSSQLDKIEIMTNPPAKYDAAGNAGIINIRLKKNQNMGLNGSLNAGIGYGLDRWFPKENAGINLNYRQGKVNIFGNVSANGRDGFQTQNISRKFFENGVQTSGFDQVGNNLQKSNSVSYKAGADFFIDKKNTIGVLFNGMTGHWGQIGDNNTQIKNAAAVLDTTSITKSDFASDWSNYSTNLNFKHTYDSTGKEFSADLDYAHYNNSTDQKYRTNKFDRENILRQVRNENGTTLSGINIYSGKFDFTMPLKNKAKFEAGAKTSFVKSDNDMAFVFLKGENNETIVPDPLRTRVFVYNENINAAYVNYSKEFKKLSVQIGFRVENTNGQGTLGGKDLLKRNYTNVFPSIFFRQKLSENNQLGYSYSRRIDRPSYEDLNPFLFFLDPYTFQRGNEFLLPQYTDAIEVSHTYKNAFTTTLNFSRTNDVMTDILEQDNARKTTNQTKVNIGHVDNIGIAFSAPVPIAKWWTSNSYLNVYYNHYVGDIPNVVFGSDGSTTTTYKPLDASTVSYTFNSSHQFTLPNGYSMELSGWYQAPFIEGQLAGRSMGAISWGVQKKLMNNKATLKLNVNDVFWLNQFRGSFVFNDIDVKVSNRWESRVARLTFTYRFGNNKVAAARQRATGLEDEKNRVKGSGN
ncbi:outer membrane beta-barrel protein [Pseudarcicella hirudinis]|nr:outer membrane beta-barrel protein [Pseudarcicella hirudinis]